MMSFSLLKHHTLLLASRRAVLSVRKHLKIGGYLPVTTTDPMICPHCPLMGFADVLSLSSTRVVMRGECGHTIDLALAVINLKPQSGSKRAGPLV